jgi:hypothetical protein
MRPLRIVLVIVGLSVALFASESPFTGTSKLNIAKSKMTPPSPQADIWTSMTAASR